MQVTTRTITDLDEARTIIDRHFYANFVDVLSPGTPWVARFQVSRPAPVTFGDLSFGTDVRMRFGELGAYHVDVPLSGELIFRQGHSEPALATERSAAVFQPVGDTTLDRWTSDGRLLAVKFDRALVENQLARLLDGPVRGPIRFGHALDVTQGLGRSWLRLLRLITADAADGDGLGGHPVVGASLFENLVTGLLLATDHQYRDRLAGDRHRVAAPGTVRRTIEAMRAQPARPFTVACLADIAGVGPRALQQSFQRYVGMSPMAYLRELRLAVVHEQLRAADPGEETVAQIAYRCGFTHPGRFAAAYRRRYGAAPGETLRR